MASEVLKVDENNKPVTGFVTDDSNQYIKMARIDDTTKGLKVMFVGGTGAGSVTSVSVVTANGFAGTVATATSTPAITLTTTITGVLKGNGTAISAASAGTDYVAPGAITTSGLTMSTAKMLGRATAATGAIEEIAVTGSGSAVLANTPSLTTPDIGAATGTSLNLSGLTASLILSTDASKNLTSLSTTTYPSLTELSYVKGVTSAIQTQINTKGAGTVTTVSVTTANGVSGSVATATTTPAITLTLGAITPTTVNGNTFTSGTYTLTGQAGKTLTFNGSITLTGTDAQTYTFPTTSATIARTDAANTFTGVQTMTSPNFTTPVLGTPSSGTLTSCTGLPAAAVVAGTLGSGTFTSTRLNFTNNAITASSNAATVPITSSLSTVTNSSAATLTVTMTTTSAVDGQMTIVRILDFSAVAQTITWVNTENSTVTAPTTSNGSTTLFLTVGFMYNGGTSKWRCIASA